MVWHTRDLGLGRWGQGALVGEVSDPPCKCGRGLQYGVVESHSHHADTGPCEKVLLGGERRGNGRQERERESERAEVHTTWGQRERERRKEESSLKVRFT